MTRVLHSELSRYYAAEHVNITDKSLICIGRCYLIEAYAIG